VLSNVIFLIAHASSQLCWPGYTILCNCTLFLLPLVHELLSPLGQFVLFILSSCLAISCSSFVAVPRFLQHVCSFAIIIHAVLQLQLASLFTGSPVLVHILVFEISRFLTDVASEPFLSSKTTRRMATLNI